MHRKTTYAGTRPKLMALLLTLFMIPASYIGQVNISPEGFETFQYQEGDTTYTMKKYFFCMLESVPDRDSLPEEEIARIQTGHLAHMAKLGEEGKICLAGPFQDSQDWRGLVVYNVPTIDEARKLAAADPAVKNKRLAVRIVPWWAAVGSALE